MQTVISIVTFISQNFTAFMAALVGVLVAIVGLLHAVIGIAMLIPGTQPETLLQSIVDKLQKVVDAVSKFSAK